MMNKERPVEKLPSSGYAVALVTEVENCTVHIPVLPSRRLLAGILKNSSRKQVELANADWESAGKDLEASPPDINGGVSLNACFGPSEHEQRQISQQAPLR